MDATQFYINIASYSIYLGSGLTIIILSTPTCNQAILRLYDFKIKIFVSSWCCCQSTALSQSQDG